MLYPKKISIIYRTFPIQYELKLKIFPPTENTENGNKFDYSPFESRRKKYKTFEHESKAKPEIKTPRSKRIQKFLPFKMTTIIPVV